VPADDEDDVCIENMSVRRLMTEMKDISEVIVDLAYASLMYNSEDMAGSVKEFKGQMEDLEYAIREKVMIAARTKDDAKQLSGLLQVAASADRIAHEAVEIVKLLEVPLEKRPFIPVILNESNEKIKMTSISRDSDMVGNTIDQLMVEANTGMKIIALKNRHGWVYDPEDDTKLRAGDNIVVRGTEDGFVRLTEFASGRKKWEYMQEEGKEE
jgi:uncharacterized protein with PhoU and TrkA domain